MLQIASIYFNKQTNTVKNSHESFYQYIPIRTIFSNNVLLLLGFPVLMLSFPTVSGPECGLL